ncbi:MAG: hypothetical protein ACOX0R_02745 [Candidatus Dojkabacteria bacterium]|jgi:hypothetical protein
MSNIKKYKAVGFVESLIAIMIVGVASVVLMRLAASTLMDAVQNERIDKMTQFAIEGATMTEAIILEMKNKGEDPKEKFDLLAGATNCYVPYIVDETADRTVFDFKKDNNVYTKIVEPVDRNDSKIVIVEQDVTGEKKEYFRYVCLSAPSLSQSKYLNVVVKVGHIQSKGDFTRKNNVKDYNYASIIAL